MDEGRAVYSIGQSVEIWSVSGRDWYAGHVKAVFQESHDVWAGDDSFPVGSLQVQYYHIASGQLAWKIIRAKDINWCIRPTPTKQPETGTVAIEPAC